MIILIKDFKFTHRMEFTSKIVAYLIGVTYHRPLTCRQKHEAADKELLVQQLPKHSVKKNREG
jgi:hypothetical protein